MRRPKYMTPEECDQYMAALATGLNGEGSPSKDAIRRAIKEMDAAERREETWPEKFREEAVRRFWQTQLKALAKSNSTVLVAHNGALLTKPSRVGIKDDAGHDQQVLFVAMTWDQIEANIRREDVAAESRNINAAIYRRLLKLRAQCPTATNVGEALTELGLTIDEYLGASA